MVYTNYKIGVDQLVYFGPILGAGDAAPPGPGTRARLDAAGGAEGASVVRPPSRPVPDPGRGGPGRIGVLDVRDSSFRERDDPGGAGAGEGGPCLRRRVLGESHVHAETVLLLASELVTNSVRYSGSAVPGGIVKVTVEAGDEAIRVEVTDRCGDSVPVLPSATPADGGPVGPVRLRVRQLRRRQPG
jgi:hypothetical protein